MAREISVIVEIVRRQVNLGFTASPPPMHEWDGTLLRLRNPDGTWGNWIDLKADAMIIETVKQYTSYLEFPVLGNEATLYIDKTAERSYRWDVDKQKYYCVGTNYEEIEILDGGI